MAGEIGNRGHGGQDLIELQRGFQRCRSYQVGGPVDLHFQGTVESVRRIVLILGDDGPDPRIVGFCTGEKTQGVICACFDGVLGRVGDDPPRAVEEKQHAVVRHFLPFE